MESGKQSPTITEYFEKQIFVNFEAQKNYEEKRGKAAEIMKWKAVAS